MLFPSISHRRKSQSTLDDKTLRGQMAVLLERLGSVAVDLRAAGGRKQST